MSGDSRAGWDLIGLLGLLLTFGGTAAVLASGNAVWAVAVVAGGVLCLASVEAGG